MAALSALRALSRFGQRNASSIHAKSWKYALQHAIGVSAPVTKHHRLFSSVSHLANSSPLDHASSAASTSGDLQTTTSSELRMAIVFTCTVDGCGERSAHHFTKRSYEKGIVLVQCPNCKNRHLIADHLGWFKDRTQEGELRTVEDLLKAKGENITKGTLDIDGVVEYSE